jgi:bla regulator protein blaR1
MINYILQVVLFQALFLAVYDFFLQKETFFKWNRFYLLITPLLSFIIPLLKFESIQKSIPQEYIVQLPTVFLNPQAFIEQSNQTNLALDFISIAFYIGLGLFTLLFLIRLSKIFQLIESNTIIKKQEYSLVLLEKKQSAFSFFKYIFINEHLLKSEDLQIIKHELIHCKQNHTIDLLFFELLKIVLWFNPLVYVYQKRITILHEYISDAEVVLETDKKTYFNRLLAETFNVENISFINQFFKHSLIKKRIVMITKEKSQKMKQLKYLLIVPLLLGMLIYSSCSNNTQAEIEEINTIIKNEIIPSNGKYFEGNNGIKIFTGSNLEGRVVPFNEMTKREKEIFNNFNNLENSKIEYSLIIDRNGDRVHFIKAPMPTMNRIIDSKTEVKYEVTPLNEIVLGKYFSLNWTGQIPEGGTLFSSNDLTSDEKAEYNYWTQRAHVNYMTVGIYQLKSGRKQIIYKTNDDKLNIYSDVLEDVPYAIIEDVPVFPGCEGTKGELRLCLQEKITAHVSTNFNVNLAKNLGLSSGVKRIFVVFKIDKEGNITGVVARAPHKALQEEAIRVIKLLPKMFPGKQKGKHVGVKYSLPIAFKVE